MNSYNSFKCSGCGFILQNQNIKALGYTPKEIKKTTLCQRCFKIQHYGKLSADLTIDNNQIKTVIDNIDFNHSIVFYIVDLLDIKNSLADYNSTMKDIYFIVNKVDLLPSFKNIIKTKQIISNIIENTTGLKDIKVILTSAKENLGINDLIALLKNIKLNNKKTYFFGQTNVGKSALINTILKKQAMVQRTVVSSFVNTTLSANTIKTKEMWIIDLPGTNNPYNVLHNLPFEMQKEITSDLGYKQINYQLKDNQFFNINNFCSISVENDGPCKVSFYLPNLLNIHRTKLINQTKIWQKQINKSLSKFDYETNNYNLNEVKNNVIISGLCLISFKSEKPIKITINTIKNTCVYMQEPIL